MFKEDVFKKNELTSLLGVQYPIVQAPMFGVSTLNMLQGAAEAQTLGSLALGDLDADTCKQLLRSAKKLIDKPFAANIFVNDVPEPSADLKLQYIKSKHYIEELAARYRLDVELPDFDKIKITDYHDQVDVLIAERCHIVSFTFGMPDPITVQKLKENRTVLIGTATSVEEAVQLECLGMDVICIQGIEAGGHRGSFQQEHVPQIGGISLLAQVYDRIKIPIIYAGGIYNAKTLLAAKYLGAQGFQIGSLLLGSKESALQEFEKHRLRHVQEADIVLTKSFSGRYARGIQNVFSNHLDDTPYILPYPYQNKLTAELRKVAKSKQNADFVSIWVGQSLHPFNEDSTKQIIQKLIEEVHASL